MPDVIVFGLDPQTVPLFDIMMDVPHARTVSIPEDKAARSKDLWTALSQKRIFRLDPSLKVIPVPAPVVVPSPPSGPSLAEIRLAEVESENARLKTENAAFQAKIESLKDLISKDVKLDEVLRLLRERPMGVSVPSVNRDGAVKTVPGKVVEVDAPAFVPSEIRPKDVETRVEVSSETSQGSSVAGAMEALRRRRQGQ